MSNNIFLILQEEGHTYRISGDRKEIKYSDGRLNRNSRVTAEEKAGLVDQEGPQSDRFNRSTPRLSCSAEEWQTGRTLSSLKRNRTRVEDEDVSFLPVCEGT